MHFILIKYFKANDLDGSKNILFIRDINYIKYINVIILYQN